MRDPHRPAYPRLRGHARDCADSLWMEVSDEYDAPSGPYSDEYLEERSEQMGRKVAREWLALDPTSRSAVDAFFARWQTPEPWSHAT